MGLAVGVVDVDVHGPMQGADQHGLVGALGCVGSVDGLGLPVRPVDELLKQGHGEDVRDVLGQNFRQRGGDRDQGEVGCWRTRNRT